jgi:outer membrane immunogenic protein
VKKSIACLTALLTLGTASAVAEEMAVAPSAYITATVPYLHWSGFYIGVNGGYSLGNSSVAYSANDAAAALGTCGGGGAAPNKGLCIPNPDFHRDGPLAGGQFGFNWQINSLWLTGFEADYQWADFAGTGVSTFRLGGAGFTNTVAQQSVKSFGTARVRMGVIPAAPLLLYGTGGLAVGQVSETLNILSPGTGGVASSGFSYFCTAGAPSCFAGSSTKTLWGWSAGAGAEYAITTNLTFKGELLYVHLQAPSATEAAQGVIGATVPSSFTAGFSPVYFAVVRGGLNYRF